MNSTDPIVTAARRLARVLLKDTGHCPDIEFIGVRSSKTACETIATQSGFDIRIDRVRGEHAEKLDPGVLIARTYHAAAHMLCIQAGVSSHSKNGRHNANFELALEQLGAPEVATFEEFSKSVQLAAEAFSKVLAQQTRKRKASTKPAYERATVACPAPECRHTLTLRKTAIAKTRFLCVEHGEEMTAPDIIVKPNPFRK